MADDRKVIRCLRCNLLQYVTRNNQCRRCFGWLIVEAPATAKLEALPEPTSMPSKNFQVVTKMGARIAELRMRAGLTQGELCRRSGVTRSFLSRMECGVMCPSLATMERLAGAMGISLGLMFETGTLQDLLMNPFVRAVAVFGRTLEPSQRRYVVQILKRLEADNGENHTRRSA